MTEAGPVGPKKFPKQVTLSLDDYAHLRELAGATGSANAVELINLAIGTLEWVVSNHNAGRKVIAISEDPANGEPEELLIGPPNPDDNR